MNTSIRFLLVLTLTALPTFGEDWTTTDGKTYKGVTVVKVEADAVTIIDSDGGALVPLQVLPPNLQKKFNYDPAKAQAAAQARKADDIRSERAMEQEAQQKQEQDAREQQEAASEADQQKPHATVTMQGTVFQKIPGGGLIVACDLRGAPSDATGFENEYDQELFMLKGMPNEGDIVDNQGIGEVVYRSGTYTYTTTQGVQKTIAAYTDVGPIPPHPYVAPSVNP